ncbi:hypothetical protein ABIB75_001799 [Bradyrhizobium sp. GM2.2]|jgi:hypothetical protein|uniref:hypothetical protein n=1 Tax=Bradyrhizobium TaxID=374 RepID=UPI00039D5FBB|nr:MULTISPECIES: hypothetical protein [Bradyrhizobium]MBM7486936.1 hypothetical protein [Bradyrhizobium canariense]MCK1266436.1 hypothetical protein [Bradyrhizobium sp. 84]MCK1294268.1 hypothetical protein [Bradyrhizobium sp. 30]MCK1305588.1 hypothetical protein [Bradyrhizobium sp. 45]MCK1318613.1 hypothetical protein [Bradyrhizobium sp. 23]
MKRAILAAGAVLLSASAQAEQLGGTLPRLPFVATLSNNTPLAFGMDADQTARALGQPLQYVRGRPGNEIYLALRNIGGSRLIPTRHRLFLQFRHGRLAGWKEDYGENWMWE